MSRVSACYNEHLTYKELVSFMGVLPEIVYPEIVYPTSNVGDEVQNKLWGLLCWLVTGLLPDWISFEPPRERLKTWISKIT